MSHSMLNRKVLAAQARAHAHPYARQSPSAHPSPHPATNTGGAADDTASPNPRAAAPIPSYSSYSAAHDQASIADHGHCSSHDMSTPYSIGAYPTVPLQTAKQRAHSVKAAAAVKAAEAAVAARDAFAADNRRRSTGSLEDVLSGDECSLLLPDPSSFFHLDALPTSPTSMLSVDQQFLAGNLAASSIPQQLSATFSIGGDGLRDDGARNVSAAFAGGPRSATTAASSSARPPAPSTATRDQSSRSKTLSSGSSEATESLLTETQLPPHTQPGYPAFVGSPERLAKRPSPPVACTQAQTLPTPQTQAVRSTSSAGDFPPYAAPPSHETSSLGTSSFFRLPTSSELNLTAAAQSYQAQRAAYEYAPASTAVTGANAEQVLSVPFYPEICYMTNPEGDIVSVEDAAWNAFMDKNNAHPFLPKVARCCFPQVMGRSLFEFLRDPKLARFTRHLLHMVSTGSQPRLTYHWFCDSPTLERKMVMSVSRLTGMNSQPLVLWSSKILWERDLPVPASYLAMPATSDDPQANGAMPCCSYCKRVMVYLSDLTLTPELVASLMAGSPTGSPVLGGKTAEAGDRGGGGGGSPPQATLADSRTDLPDYEPNGLVPIFGLRGKRGVQERQPFSAGTTHVWLTPTQYSLARVSSPASHVYHGVCEVCWGELVSFFGL